MLKTPLLLIALFFPAYPVHADGLAEYRPIISSISNQWDVPEKLVHAIIKQESAFNPWAVNVAGTSYMPRSKAEALKVANAAFAAGKSFDVGLMQINSYWLRRFGMTPEYVIEPKRNIIIGIWILAQEIKRYGLTWQAVASYHTPVDRNPERGERYARAIISHLRRMP